MSKYLTLRLTVAQADTLLDAASAMLAGPEGEGDAVGVSFARLREAHDKLARAVAESEGGQR